MHRAEPELARGVGGVAGKGDAIGDGADRHDVPRAALPHGRQHGAHEGEGRGEIELEGVAERLD